MATPKNIIIELDEDEQNLSNGAHQEKVIDMDDGASLSDDIIDEDAQADGRLPSRARPNANGSVTLPLLEEVTLKTRKNGEIRNRVFTELTFHRFNGADLRAIGATSKETATIVSFARSTRIPEMLMDRLFDLLDGADITDAGSIIQSFLKSGRKTSGR